MLNILVVEDDQQQAERCISLIRGVLSDCEIFVAKDGQTALHLLEGKMIDAAFIDKELPDIDGFILVEKIRAQKGYFQLPIIFVAASDEDSLENRGKYHHYDYIVKPYKRDRFLHIAKRFLCGISDNKDFLEQKREKGIYIKTAEKNQIFIKYSELLFAEIVKRKLEIHTIERTYVIPAMDLPAFISDVDSKYFVRTHRSVAANLQKVKQVVKLSQKSWDLVFDDVFDIKCGMSNHFRKNVQSILDEIGIITDNQTATPMTESERESA